MKCSEEAPDFLTPAESFISRRVELREGVALGSTAFVTVTLVKSDAENGLYRVQEMARPCAVCLRYDDSITLLFTVAASFCANAFAVRRSAVSPPIRCSRVGEP